MQASAVTGSDRFLFIVLRCELTGRDGRASRNRVRRWWFGVRAGECVQDLLLDGRHSGLRGNGEFGTGESGTADFRRDTQGAGDLRESHFTELFIAEGFEETLSG